MVVPAMYQSPRQHQNGTSRRASLVTISAFALVVVLLSRREIVRSVKEFNDSRSLSKNAAQDSSNTNNNIEYSGPYWDNFHVDFPFDGCPLGEQDSEPFQATQAEFYPDILRALAYVQRTEAKINHQKKDASMTLMSTAQRLITTQTCQYSNVIHFAKLAKSANLTRWTAIGGTAIGALCYTAMAPWDDDIDLMLMGCSELDQMFQESPAESQYKWMDEQNHEFKVIQNEHLLLKKEFKTRESAGVSWKYKWVGGLSKDVSDISAGNMDIICLENSPSKNEREVVNATGFTDYCELLLRVRRVLCASRTERFISSSFLFLLTSIIGQTTSKCSLRPSIDPNAP